MRKKMFITVTIMTVVFSLYYTVALAKDPIGFVTALTGEAFVTHTGEKEQLLLKLNDPVFLGDIIQTAAESKVQILMEDDSLLNMGEKAQITIKEHLYQPKKDLRSAVYKLLSGKVRVVVGKLFRDPDSRLEVETPTSVIGIRMTEFVVWIVDAQLTVVIAIEGAVVAKNIRADLVCKETVAAGYQSNIAKDTCPIAPVETPIEIMEEILLETKFYMQPPDAELPSTSELLMASVQTVLADAPALAPVSTDTLETGMKGTGLPVAGGDILTPSTAEGADLQYDILQPGETVTDIPFTPGFDPDRPSTPDLPIVLPPLPIPKPPGPPGSLFRR